jgi:phospholipid/cholesterol/gamma-HCH transport system substrate-binding protein
MRDQRVLNFKVGLFVLISLVVFLAFIFALGGEGGLFKRSYSVQTSFTNTAGLSQGAAVRLSGVLIGSVKEIHFPENPDENFIVVSMEVNEDGIKRIGSDSIATIRTEGLLGDKYIEIIKGTKEVPKEIPKVTQITSYTPPQLEKLLGQSEELIDNIMGISQSLDKIVKGFGKDENIENINSIIASINKTVEAIETQPGVLHSLIYAKKKKSGNGFDQNTLERFDEAITMVNELLVEIRSGNGALNAFLYDDKLREQLVETIASINSAAEEIGGQEGITSDLKETMSNFRRISESLADGEGTLGALLIDPTIYDQLKGVLGEADRSRFVRAAVRYLIENKSTESDQKK